MKSYCDFCEEGCDGKNILRSTDFEKKDGSDIIVCDDCLNDYANHDFTSLIKRMRGL